MASGKNSILGIAAGAALANAAPKVAKKTRRLLFRWRRFLAPVWMGFFIYLASVILRWQAVGWWPTVLALPFIGVGLSWAGPALSDRWSRVVMAMVPAGLDKGRDGVLDRPIERIYFAALMVYIGAYMSVRTALGPSEFSGWMWTSGVVLFGGTWWYHRRVRVAGRADRFAKKWPIFADKDTCPFRLSPLVGSKVVRAESMGRVSVLTIRLAPAQTADAVVHVTGPLASYFSMRTGSVFAKGDDMHARNVVFTFLPANPWKGKIPHPMPIPGTVSLASLHGRFSMGLEAIGREITYKLQHTLVVGANGSGKSIWLHSLMVWLTACTDCIVVGIDMASGATLSVWRKALALPLAIEVDMAIIILERVLGVIREREIALGLASEDDDDPEDSFSPSAKTPWLVLIIDEFPDLLAEAKSAKDGNGQPLLNYVILLLSRIAKKARKCGVRLVVASQNGTKVDLGSKEMQAQLKAIVGLSLDSMQSKNLWGELQRDGWKSTDLREGQFLLRDDEHRAPDIAKGYFVEPKARKEHVAKVAELRKALEPEAWAVLMGTSDVDYIDAEVVLPEQRGPEDAVLEYLRDEGPAKAEKISEVFTAAKAEGDKTGTSRATIYRRLEILESRGLVTSADGVWSALPAQVPVPIRKTESEPGTQMVSIQGEQLKS